MSSETCEECKHYFSCSAAYEGNCVCDDFIAAVPLTYGDKVRQMSNEELAELLTNPPCFVCSKGDAAGECTDTWRKKDCKSAILERLNAPAESEVRDEQ